MNRMLRAVIAIIFIAVITFSAISICQNIAKTLKIDITDQNIYTLSDGTKNILAKLSQPLKVKLYYTKTAAMKGPDQIRYFNNYYHFVKALLEEYESAAKGMIELQIIDPRPFSDEEAQAIRYGLKRFTVTEEENFFFGLVLQTQFGVEKAIDFFSPDRQNFIEYDISYLIDTTVTRQKKRVGVLSALPVTGDDVTGYMAQMMRMQGQQPKQPWAIVSHLKQMFEVNKVDADTGEIKDVDVLLVIHPKGFSEKTLFAIDQYVLKGGRTIVFVDPHCVADMPDPAQKQMGQIHPTASNLDKMFKAWGIQMPANTFAGDRSLAVLSSVRANQRPQKLIPLLNLNQQCFNTDSVISADLNEVKVFFSGILEEIEKDSAEETETKIQITPLITTTSLGNSWKISSPYELTPPNFSALMKKFTDGTKPVTMGCLVTGRFKSSFPDGIEVPDESIDEETKSDEEGKSETVKRITGLTEAPEDCAVIVFADVDFISDLVAYRKTFFGLMPLDDNSSLLLNSIEDLAGSSDLISIRSRGNFKRPFTAVDEIEIKAEAETAEEEAKINAAIAGFQQELNEILASVKKDQAEVIGNTIVQEKKRIELQIHQAQRQLRQIKNKKRQNIERLGVRLRNFCTLPGPIVILIIAIGLGIRRSVMRRHYISHASDS